MKQERTPREAETRQENARANTPWTPPSLLPDPEPREGIVHRWVTFEAGGRTETLNISQRIREGWTVCSKDDYPEFQEFGEQTTDGSIKMGGLVLCKMPEQRAKQRDAYYANQAKANERSMDAQLMKNSDARMPILKPERKTEVQFGSGSRLSNSVETN